jgi:gliding motility-associated-like protein
LNCLFLFFYNHKWLYVWLCVLFLPGPFAIPSLFAQQIEYSENKGQWHEDVRFMGRLSAGNLFLTKNGYRVLQYHPDDYLRVVNHAAGHNFLQHANKEQASDQVHAIDDEMVVRSHAYQVSFTGGNPKSVVAPEIKLPGYSNYYIGNNPAQWASMVNSYGVVTYQGMYRGVDVRYYADNGFVKYDLLVAAGGAFNEIVMEYTGVDALKVIKGELHVMTSVGKVVEREPYAYQLINGVRKQVPCTYVVNGNTVRFRIPAYDASAPLVIDPTFVFSTYAGSVPDNWGYTATFDKDGNAYGGGIVMGTGYPTTTGAFQTTYGGGTSSNEGPNGFDINIVKLNPEGRTRIYSTYLGGNSNEQPHSLVVDSDGNLVVAGRTLSTNYPLRGAGSIGPGGQWDVIVTKFNAAGSNLIGSVRIGGSGNDGVNVRHKFPNPGPGFTDQNYGDDARSEVVVDEAGNIYVAGCTQSNNFPVTAGALQSTLSGTQDALVLKFNPTLTNLDFATYLGGSGYDAAYVLTVEAGGDILVAGGTMSNNFPGDKLGTVGAGFEGGNLDGFIARISNNGTQLRKSTYIGTAANDQLYGIQKDKNGFIYVMGTSTGNFPVRNAAFRQAGGKQFIAKLQPDFTGYVYSTVFGTNNPNPNISPTAFLVDNCENVYVSGWGGNIIPGASYAIAPTTGLTVTPDAIKANTDGIDFYFFVLEKDAVSQLYGSFFGQQDPSNPGSHDHVDGGTSRFDENGIIYQGICANCNGGQFPTTPGTISPNNPSARCNLAVVKINFDLSGVRTGIQSFIDGQRRDSSGCVPATIEFVDSIAIGKRFEWSFGDGSPQVLTDTPFTVHTFDRVGNYRVRLIAIDDEKCIPRDTAYINVRVRVDRVRLNADAVLLPPCQDLNYRFNNLSTPFPGKPFKDSSFVWIFGDNSAPLRAGLESVTHKYPSPGTYNVQLILADTNYCNAPDTFRLQVRVNPNVGARFEAPLTICAPARLTMNNTSLGGTTFFWDFGNGFTSTEVNPQVFYALPGIYRVKLLASDPNTCNGIDSTFFTINVSGAPNAQFNFSPQPSEENIPTTFINLSGPAALYRWDFGDGDTLRTVRRDTLIRHQFPRTDVFNTCLIAINEFGCADTTCLPIVATVTPVIDVVTAFTPNEDGVNDRAVVYGFGVVRMTFRIFNRWGQLMYESSDPTRGWDGKFKGQPQPMDAYAYTLDAELIDNTRVKRSGNITLIR